MSIDQQYRLEDQARIHTLRTSRQSWAKILLWWALLGPGIIVMIADNDAGGVITYAQTGALYGIGFFIPALILGGLIAFVVQEMTVRLGSVTHRGHAEMIWGRYGPFWGWFSLIDLVIANGLTLITEFIGITVGLSLWGISPVISTAGALVLDAGVLLGLRYRAWERVALWIAAGNLVFVPLAFLSHPHWGHVVQALSSWTIPGGWTATFLFIILANFGTTIAPWMLFFQQSSVVDKGLTVTDIRHGQWDTAIGSLLMVLVALAIVILTGTLFAGHPASYALGQILQRLGQQLGPIGQTLFAVGLVEAGVIALIALTASTSWAMGEALGWPNSINLPARTAWKFYAPGLGSAVLAAGIVLIPHAPLGFLNLLVQVIASIFMPAALLFLLLLLNDAEIMGSYRNKSWQNLLAYSIVGLLVLLNGLYGFSLLWPH